MACGVKKIGKALVLRLLLAVACIAPGCSPKTEQAQDAEAYLRSKGYSRAPQIEAIVPDDAGNVTASGRAAPDGRVRFLYGGQRAIGVTADSKGRFKADLPVGGQGELFDVSVDDGGRLMQAEGRLFVPPSNPQKAVMLRPGLPSQPVHGDADPISILDFDNTGALVLTGKVAPRTEVTLGVDGQGITTATSDATGLYYMQVHVAPPAAGAKISLNVQAGSVNAQRAFDFSPADPKAGDRITPADSGWRVDWVLPGGGMQTTVVF